MNEFDQAVAGMLPEGDEYEQAVTGALSQSAIQTRLGFMVGSRQNPDSYAEARRVAASTGVPVDTVLALPQEMQLQATMGSIDFDNMVATAPATAALLSDIQKAGVAHDNVGSLQSVEQTLYQLAGRRTSSVFPPLSESTSSPIAEIRPVERSFLGGIFEPLRRGWAMGDAGAALMLEDSGFLSGWQRQQKEAAEAHGVTYTPLAEAAGIVAQRSRQAARFPLPDSVAAGMQAIGQSTSFGEAARAIIANPSAVIETTLQSLGLAAPAMATGVGLGTVAGPWGAALGAGSGSLATEYASTLLDVLNDSGVDTSDPAALAQALSNSELMTKGREKGFRRGLAVGAFDALTAGFAGRLLAGANPTALSMGGRAAGELGVQAAGGAAGEATAQGLTGEFKPGDILMEAIAELPTGLHEIPVNMQHGLLAARHRETVARYRAEQAIQSAETLTQLTQLAAADKLLAREPETFEAFVQQAAQDSPVENIYIDGNVLMQSGLGAALAQVSPTAAAQLETAVATGGQIAIPVGEYAARIAPTNLAPQLLDHLKTDPEGFSRAEAQVYMQTQGEQLQADITKALTDSVTTELARASQETVRQQVLEQLNTAGRFTPAVNAAYSALVAAHYATRAEQMGVTPEELFAQRPLRVVAEGVEGDQLEQALATQPPKGWQHSTGGEEAVALWDGQTKAQAVFWTDLDGKLSQDAPDLAGYSFSIDKSRVDHIRKRHGNAKAESLSGQVAITGADIARIPEIVQGYDAANTDVPMPDETGQQTQRGVVFAKKFEDGVVVYSGLVSRGRQNVRTATMWKYPPSLDAQTALQRATLNLTSETNGGMSESVSKGKAKGKSYDQGARGAFSPEQRAIALLKAADLSTFLHEAGHFFFEDDINLASELIASQRDGVSLSPGEQQILRDVGTLMSWHGLKGDLSQQLAEWHNMDFEEKRSHHERTAESFERYLFEGRAPSLELVPYFQRFRTWLVNVYRSLKDFLAGHPQADQLSPEVRSVFDRMLASEDQITLAEQGRSLVPMFATADEAGMTAEEFAAYQETGRQATADAVENIQARGLRDMQWLRNARGRELKRLQKEAAGLRAEEEMAARTEVYSDPLYQAWQHLTAKVDADNPDGGARLDATFLEAMGLPAEVVNTLKARKMVAKKGLHPDFVAEQFGFSSGDELVRKLAAAETPQEMIDALTDVRMLEAHGELATPEAIERAADEAIHNAARMRMVASEEASLAQATGKPRVLERAAREFAAQLIARQRVRDLRPGQYTNAETRAAREADKARKAGDLQRAAAEKRNQLLQGLAAREALRARGEVERTVRYLRTLDGKAKGLDAAYADQIEQLLERFDLRSSQSLRAIDKRTSLAAWLESQREQGFEPDVPEDLQNEALRKSYKDMTVEELRGLADTVRQIEHLGRLKHRLLTDRQHREFAQVRDALVVGIHSHFRGDTPSQSTPATNSDDRKLKAHQFFLDHLKVANIAQVMDGGETGGPVWDFFARTAQERANWKATRQAEMTERLMDIMTPVLRQGNSFRQKRMTALGISMTREQVFAIALNMGNEGNLSRLLTGDIEGQRFSPQQLTQLIEAELTSADLHAVQGIWDLMAVLTPEAQAKHMRMYGKGMALVDPKPITLTAADGIQVMLRGGYYPIVYDPRGSNKIGEHEADAVAKDALRAAHTAATTRRSYTKARVDETPYPLLLTMGGVHRGLSQVVHDLAWHEWSVDAGRMLRDDKFRAAVRETYGDDTLKTIKQWHDDIVTENVKETAAWERATVVMRSGVSAAAMGYSFLTAIQQPIGLTQSMAKIGSGQVFKAVTSFMGAPREQIALVREKSEFMRNRSRTRFREVADLKRQIDLSGSRLRQAHVVVVEHAFDMMGWVQTTVDVPTWKAAYEKALAEGHDDATAVSIADQAVIDTQGDGALQNLAAVQRSRIGRWLTLFYSYLSSALNMIWQTSRSERAMDRKVTDVLLLTMIPATLTALVKWAVKPGDGDDEEKYWKLVKDILKENISLPLSMFVFIRELADPISAMVTGEPVIDYRGPGGFRTMADATALIGRTGASFSQGEVSASLPKAAINLAGDLTGLPSAQVNRTIQGAKALAEGETQNPAALAFGFQKPR